MKGSVVSLLANGRIRTSFTHRHAEYEVASRFKWKGNYVPEPFKRNKCEPIPYGDMGFFVTLDVDGNPVNPDFIGRGATTPTIWYPDDSEWENN